MYPVPGSQSVSGGWSQTTPMNTSDPSGKNGGLFSNILDTASDFTVQFGVQGAPASQRYNCQAIVSWQLNGNMVQRRVSVVSGMSITGRGQGVQVQLVDVTNATAPGIDYVVTTLLSRGLRAFGCGMCPFLFETFQTVTAGSSIIVNVPTDSGIYGAQVLAVSSTDPMVAPLVRVVAQNNAGDPLQAWDPSIVPGFVQLPPFREQIEIENTSATDDVFVTVLWGVEG